MRQDMYQVLREAARSAAQPRTQRPNRLVDGESLEPTRQSMRATHRLHWGGKCSRLNLAPLKRFIASRVGQPWSTVYAELRQSLRRRDSLLDDPMHYLDIEVNTSMVDGEVCVNSSFGGVHAVHTYGCAYYVHPESGLLCANNVQARRAQERRLAQAEQLAQVAAARRELSDSRQLHFHKGQWYVVELKELPSPDQVAAYLNRGWGDPVVDVERYDVVTESTFCCSRSYELARLYGRDGVFGVSKRQLSHKELKRYGLLASRTH